MMKKILTGVAAFIFLGVAVTAFGLSDVYEKNVYDAGSLKPVDSVLKVRVGDKAPALPSLPLTGRRLP